MSATWILTAEILKVELASQLEALQNSWPNARQFLCLLHYLQRRWKWLGKPCKELTLMKEK